MCRNQIRSLTEGPESWEYVAYCTFSNVGPMGRTLLQECYKTLSSTSRTGICACRASSRASSHPPRSPSPFVLAFFTSQPVWD